MHDSSRLQVPDAEDRHRAIGLFTRFYHWLSTYAACCNVMKRVSGVAVMGGACSSEPVIMRLVLLQNSDIPTANYCYSQERSTVLDCLPRVFPFIVDRLEYNSCIGSNHQYLGGISFSYTQRQSRLGRILGSSQLHTHLPTFILARTVITEVTLNNCPSRFVWTLR